jgi:hypothetical protein
LITLNAVPLKDSVEHDSSQQRHQDVIQRFVGLLIQDDADPANEWRRRQDKDFDLGMQYPQAFDSNRMLFWVGIPKGRTTAGKRSAIPWSAAARCRFGYVR